jgi:hypothetical protein
MSPSPPASRIALIEALRRRTVDRCVCDQPLGNELEPGRSRRLDEHDVGRPDVGAQQRQSCLAVRYVAEPVGRGPLPGSADPDRLRLRADDHQPGHAEAGREPPDAGVLLR